MGNYFNELRSKNIRANNLLFLHQVTIDIRFRKSLTQERFKSNLEFKYQIIVSSIKFIINLVETISLEIDKRKSKNAALLSEVLAFLSWSSEE